MDHDRAGLTLIQVGAVTPPVGAMTPIRNSISAGCLSRAESSSCGSGNLGHVPRERSMLRKSPRFAVLALAAFVGGSLEAHVWAADAKPTQSATFEFLRSTDADTARGQGLGW